MRRGFFRVALGMLVLLSLCFNASAQSAKPAPGTVASSVPPVTGQARKADSGVSWEALSPEQRLALQPLAGSWATLSNAQKRKWVALSRNYGKLPAPEQALLQGRMTSWSALSRAERGQARLNFSESRSLQAEDRRARWEAYQALTPEQRNELSRQRAAQRRAGSSVAESSGPALSNSLYPAESVPSAERQRKATTQVVLPAGGVDANTLLPRKTQGEKKP